MPHRTDGAEAWALGLLNEIVDCDKRNRDALPGSVVKKVKEARRILIKLKKRAQKESGHLDNDRCFIAYVVLYYTYEKLSFFG